MKKRIYVTDIIGYIGDTVLDNVYANATKVLDALKAAGLSDPGATYAMYQAYHESQAFTSPLYLQHNNASGIKYASQKGATKGPGPNHYAYFDTLASWAAAMAHEATKGSNPAAAQSLEDYADRLKKDGYYEDTLDNYTHGLTRARLVLKEMPAADNAVGPGSATDSWKDKWNKLPLVGKIGVGVLGLFILKEIID